MHSFIKEYYVAENHRDDFEEAYGTRGAFGRMCISHGCIGYALLRHKRESGRYAVIQTWADGATFSRAQKRAAQESYNLQKRYLGVWKVLDLTSAPDEDYQTLSKA